MQKTVLITGGSSGIGYELAKLFARDKWKIVLVSRSKSELLSAAAQLQKLGAPQVTVFSKDLSKPGACRQVFNELKKKKVSVDALVNNAGFGLYGKFQQIPLEKQLQMLRVNNEALVELTGLFLRQMLERKSGRILNLASTAAFQPGPLMATYYASKAFVLSFSQALAEELESSNSGVSVTCLCPGPTWTGFQKRAGMLNSKVLGGNVMTAEKVAQVAYGDFLKGERIVVPGFRNKLGAKIVRLLPAKLVTKLIRRVQEERQK